MTDLKNFPSDTKLLGRLMHLFKNIQKNEPVAVNYVTFAIAYALYIGILFLTQAPRLRQRRTSPSPL